MITNKKSLTVLMITLGVAFAFFSSAQAQVIPKSTTTTTNPAQDAIDDIRAKKYEDAYRKIQTATEDSIFSKNDILFITTQALLHIDEKKAVEFAKKTLAEIGDDEQFMSNLSDEITQSKGLSKDTYLYGVEILKKITATMPEFSYFYIVYDYTGRCLYYAGDVAQAITYAEKSIADAKKNKAHEDTMTYLQGVLTQYKTPKS